MEFSELLSLEPKKFLEVVREFKIDIDADIEEYANARVQRDNQVGKRLDKVTAQKETLPVNKIPIPFQNNIVRTSAVFMFGNPVNLVSEDDISEIKAQWKSLRLDGYLLKCAEYAKAYRHSGFLFRVAKSEKNGLELKANLLDPRKNTLIPIFNDWGDMEGFVIEKESKDEEGETVNKIYIYDKTNVRIWVETEDGIIEESNTKHYFNRIPIAYIQEEQVDYEEVKPLIDRYENRFSRLADTNDYFSSPFFKSIGKIDNVPTKDETGSVFMMDVIETDKGTLIQSDLDVVSWDSSPESTKMELEIAKGLIYDLSMTPDLSFDNVKGLGNISGIALQLMFISPIMKSKLNESIYGVFVSRIVNLVRAGMVATSEASETIFEADIDVNFTSILPEHIQEIIETLSAATQDKTLSVETALSHNPLVKDPIAELERIKNEKEIIEPIGGSLNL